MKPTTSALYRLLFYSAAIFAASASHAWEIDQSKFSLDGPAAFGIEKLRETSGDGEIDLHLLASDDTLQAEGFRLSRKGDTLSISALDEAGLMYGALELAERIRIGKLHSLHVVEQNPYMQMRGSKFNIPLDARTPSYTDPSDTSQQNIPAVWDFEFWKEYIDRMALARYNFVSLWSLNPFPSIVHVPGYEDVSLQDVWRSRTIRSQEHYSLGGQGLVTPEILDDAEIVLEISMEQKIDFWRRVMAYGKSRNIDFYFITWNIFTDGTFGKYGITDDIENPTTRDYFRKSVATAFATYPDLAGIGLTTGENMQESTLAKKEEWAFETYGRGVLDAAAADPERKIRFIHRNHQADSTLIRDRFSSLIDNQNIDFIFSFKYAKAHVYSSTRQHYHPKFVEELRPTGLKTIWTQRNDDTYYFRWGAPDFVREFIQNIPSDVSQGHYLGSDQWIWGRDFLQRNRAPGEQLEIAKQDYQWHIWGRLSYDLTLSNERFTDWLADRYGLDERSSIALFDAWQTASYVYPTVTGFHWGHVDYTWYIEACQSREGPAQNETGFHDVNRFITLPPHPLAGYQSIPDFVSGLPTELLTPYEVAARLDDLILRSEASLKQLEGQDNDALADAIADIRIVAQLGKYYSSKIRGATELAFYRETNDPARQSKSISHLVSAAKHWKAYTELVLKSYRNPLWTNRVGIVDFKQNYIHALDDIRIAGGDPEEHKLPARIEAQAEPISRPWEEGRFQ